MIDALSLLFIAALYRRSLSPLLALVVRIPIGTAVNEHLGRPRNGGVMAAMINARYMGR
jgi:hypothetical protein